MIFVLLLLPVAALLSLLVSERKWQARSRIDAWRQACAQLDVEESDARGSQAFAGRHDGICVSLVAARRGVTVIRCEIGGPTAFGGVTLEAAARQSKIEVFGAKPAKKVWTGDAEFDAAVHVTGHEGPALAMLSADARTQVRLLMAENSHISGGTVWMEVENPTALQLIPAMKRCIHTTKALSALTTVERRLCENLLTEPEATVRVRLLSVLGAEHRTSPAAIQVAEQLLGDAEPAVRLEAAQLAPEDAARACLDALVRAEDISPRHRAKALELLGGRHGSADLSELTSLGLDSPEIHLQLAAARLAGARLDHGQQRRLQELTRGLDPELRESAAQALGALGNPSAEDALLALLSDDASVQLAAMKALGKLGTLRAVEALLPLTQTGSRGGVRDAARDALRTIQERHGGGDRGGVSLLPEDRAGELSLAKGEPTREGES